MDEILARPTMLEVWPTSQWVNDIYELEYTIINKIKQEQPKREIGEIFNKADSVLQEITNFENKLKANSRGLTIKELKQSRLRYFWRLRKDPDYSVILLALAEKARKALVHQLINGSGESIIKALALLRERPENVFPVMSNHHSFLLNDLKSVIQKTYPDPIQVSGDVTFFSVDQNYLSALRRFSEIEKRAVPIVEREKTARISAPIHGLYDSISVDNVVTLDHIKIINKVQGGLIESIIQDSTGERLGSFRRHFSSDKTSIEFSNAYLDKTRAPSFVNVPGVVPLVPGRGIPTQAFITLQQMKIAGVRYGGMKKAETSTIGNIRTCLELLQVPNIKNWIRQHPTEPIPNEIMSRAILNTHTGQYISTVLTQSGHKITAVRVIDGRYIRIGKILSENIEPDLLQSIIAERRSDGRAVPFSAEQKIPFMFRISFDLEPIQ